MHEPFPFGKYKGRTPAYIGLQDYQWLAWIHDKVQKSSLWIDVDRTRYALNHFTPIGTCFKCKEPAKTLSIANYGIFGSIVEDAYVFCEQEECQYSTGLDGGRKILPITFDIMAQFEGDFREPKRAMKSLQKQLNGLAGITGRITEAKAQDFIDDLIAKDGNYFPRYRPYP